MPRYRSVPDEYGSREFGAGNGIRHGHRMLSCGSDLALLWSTTAEGLAVKRGYAANGPCQARPDGGCGVE
jgi:hypothetical protein